MFETLGPRPRGWPANKHAPLARVTMPNFVILRRIIWASGVITTVWWRKTITIEQTPSRTYERRRVCLCLTRGGAIREEFLDYSGCRSGRLSRFSSNFLVQNFYKDFINSFYVKLLTDRQTNGQINKQWVNHKLLGWDVIVSVCWQGGFTEIQLTVYLVTVRWHSGFVKLWFLLRWPYSESKFASAYQISSKSDE